MIRSLPLALLLAGCSDQFENELGGPQGSNSGGYNGPQHCWDLDYDGEADANEDTNGDGTVDVYDCRGEDGSGGAGSNGSDGQDCWDLDGDGIGDPEEDTNGDGVVDVYDCRDDEGDDTGDGGGEYLGDLTLDSADAIELFCANYSVVYGDLFVEATGDELNELACIEAVHGDLTIWKEDDAASSLPALATVDGWVWMKLRGDSSFDSLEAVGRYMRIDLMAETSSMDVSFPSLTSVGTAPGDDRLEIYGVGPSSATLDMTALVEVDGDLQLLADSLQDLDGLSALSTVGGQLSIRSCETLTDVTGLHSLALVAGPVEVSNNPSLPTSAAETLVSEIDVIGGTVTVSGNGPG